MSDVKDNDLQKRLKEALAKRKERDDARKNVEDMEKAIEQAKNAVKEAKKKLKTAKKTADTFNDETEVIKKLAGYSEENPTTRKAVAGYYFYKILDMFDTKDGKVVENGDFHQKYNQLKADDICKAVLASLKYYDNGDNICIYGDRLRAEIDKLVKKKEADIASAQNLLDAEYLKIVNPENKKE